MSGEEMIGSDGGGSGKCNADAPEEKETPFDNPLLITEIFKRLPCEAQKEFRLASKTCMELTLGYWRSHVEVTIGNNYSSCVERFMEMSTSVGSGRFYQIEEYPFRNFSIEYQNVNWKHFQSAWVEDEDVPSEKEKDDAWRNFWTKFGTSMDSLVLLEGEILGFSKWITFFKVILDVCPSLKSLMICSIDEKTMYEESDIVDQIRLLDEIDDKKVFKNLEAFGFYRYNWKKTWDIQDGQQILKLMPHLKELDLNYPCFAIALNLPKPIDPVRKPFKYFQLKKLSLGSCVPSEDDESPESAQIFKKLKEYVEVAKPPLKCLDINMDDFNVFVERKFCIQEFIDCCRNKLECIEFNTVHVNPEDVGQCYWFRELSFGDFPQLAIIEITFTESGRNEAVTQFDFSAWAGMPKLKKFICNSSPAMDWEPPPLTQAELSYREQEQNESELKMNDLKEFRYSLRRKLNVDCLKKIASWAKNIKKLTLVFDESTFPAVFKLWPNLEQVKLLKDSKVPEEIIAGVKATTFCEIDTSRNFKGYWDWMDQN